MRICLISDTHGYHDNIKLPKGDILIHSGDISIQGEIYEVKAFIDWFGRQPFKHKIFINGNHEVAVSQLGNLTSLLVIEHNKYNFDNIIYLEEQEVTIEGLKIYGSPYTPEFFNWAYMYQRKNGVARWKGIPPETDIIISHGPPYGKLDKTNHPRIGEDPHVGCHDLLAKVLEIKPKLHVFGHIHESAGYIKGINTLYVNASICDGKYRTVNKPIVVDSETWEVIKNG